MYEIKRARRLEEEVKLNSEVLKISLNLEEVVFDILKIHNECLKTECEISKASGNDELLKLYENHGANIINLIEAFFGKEQTENIMRFFSKNNDDNEIDINQTCLGEVMEQVGGYIITELMPVVSEFAKEKRKSVQDKFLNKQVK